MIKMDLIKAKQDFQIRYYRWAISEFEKEIESSFPNLRLFKSGAIWELHQFMLQIDESERLILAHGLLKKFHSEAVKLLGGKFSEEETILLDRCGKFRSQFYGRGKEVMGNESAGKKIKFVSKNKLKKIIISKFTKEFGGQCVKMITEEGWDPWFEMKIAGWIVTTQFTFGRQENMIEYYQAIQSEAKVPNPSFSPEFWVAAMRLEQLISFASWLGICSQTQWKYPTEEDVDQACDIFIKFCGYFLEAAPKLLKGLEFEKITEGRAAIFAASQSV